MPDACLIECPKNPFLPTLHIRTVGPWGLKLHSNLESPTLGLQGGELVHRAEAQEAGSNSKKGLVRLLEATVCHGHCATALEGSQGLLHKLTLDRGCRKCWV